MKILIPIYLLICKNIFNRPQGSSFGLYFMDRHSYNNFELDKYFIIDYIFYYKSSNYFNIKCTKCHTKYNVFVLDMKIK